MFPEKKNHIEDEIVGTNRLENLFIFVIQSFARKHEKSLELKVKAFSAFFFIRQDQKFELINQQTQYEEIKIMIILFANIAFELIQ